MSAATRPAVSVVVPAHDEEENVAPLYEEIRSVLEERRTPFEIVFVNDGSTDETGDRLRALAQRDPRLRVLELDGNFGEAAALTAGFQHASGDVVVTLDGDGQNDPADIPKLLNVLGREGVRVVSGRREQRREDFWLRVVPSRLANALIVRATGIPVHDCGCGLKAYERGALPAIQLPPGMHRFLPAILGVEASQVAEVPVRDRVRQHGSSHYGIGRVLIVLRDLLALRAVIRNPRRAEVGFALRTAGAAGLGAVLMQTSWLLTALCDAVAVLSALAWWNARRFNRAQREGVYRLRPADRE